MLVRSGIQKQNSRLKIPSLHLKQEGGSVCAQEVLAHVGETAQDGVLPTADFGHCTLGNVLPQGPPASSSRVILGLRYGLVLVISSFFPSGLIQVTRSCVQCRKYGQVCEKRPRYRIQSRWTPGSLYCCDELSCHVLKHHLLQIEVDSRADRLTLNLHQYIPDRVSGAYQALNRSYLNLICNKCVLTICYKIKEGQCS